MLLLQFPLGMPAIWVRFPDRACYYLMLGVKTWVSTLMIVYIMRISDETPKTDCPFYLVFMSEEANIPQGVNV